MKVLITGKNSYVGRAAALRLTEAGHEVEELDMIGKAWKEKDFSGFDCVFHVAGIAHDVKGKQNEGLYMAVNRDLAGGRKDKRNVRRKFQGCGAASAHDFRQRLQGQFSAACKSCA